MNKMSKRTLPPGIRKIGSCFYVQMKMNGRTFKKSCGPDLVLAKRVRAEFLSQRTEGHLTEDWSGFETLVQKRETKTFAEAAQDYMTERTHLMPTTRRGYEQALRVYLLPAFGQMKLYELKEADIAKFQAEISQRVSATRTNNIMGPMRYILHVCHRRKLISENPIANVDRLREEMPDIDPFTLEELEAALASALPHYRPFFECQAWTGARPNELMALRWKDVDFERAEIHITKGRVRGHEGKTKTAGSRRVIRMFSRVREILETLKESRNPDPEEYVFKSKHGNPINKHLGREWTTACQRAGIRHRPSYQLRHTFASQCLSNGVDPGFVARQLGHSNLQILFQHYARFIKKSGCENEDRIERFIPKGKGGQKAANSNTDLQDPS